MHEVAPLRPRFVGASRYLTLRLRSMSAVSITLPPQIALRSARREVGNPAATVRTCRQSGSAWSFIPGQNLKKASRSAALSAPARPPHAKGKPMKKGTSKRLTPEQRAELKSLAALPDDAIDTSDAPELLDWSGAKRGLFYRPVKQQLTLRLDADVIAWFKSHTRSNEGCQTRINRVLREYVQGQASRTRDPELSSLASRSFILCSLAIRSIRVRGKPQTLARASRRVPVVLIDASAIEPAGARSTSCCFRGWTKP